MKKIKFSEKSKIETEINGEDFHVSIKSTQVKKIAIKETIAKRSSKTKKNEIRSKVWKFICMIIEKMVTAIISAIVNGLFYILLILERMSFFIKKGDIYG